MLKVVISSLVAAFIVAYPVTVASAKIVTVAVVDSGIDPSVSHLCKFGHKNFTDEVIQSPFYDSVGHGTHIAGLITKYAGNSDAYCLVSIKYYVDKSSKNVENFKKAVQYAVNIHADFINISGGGNEPDLQERKSVLEALEDNITVVVAAGNDGKDLDKRCNYFPACYDNRIITVGNLMKATPSITRNLFPSLYTRYMFDNADIEKTKIAPSSNYGHYIKRWEIGTNVMSNLPMGRQGYMSGTSQATAITTGKLLKERIDHENGIAK